MIEEAQHMLDGLRSRDIGISSSQKDREDDILHMMGWKVVSKGFVQHQVRLLTFFPSCLIAYSVVQGEQYAVIIVPTLLVGVFLILLAVILWLFIRGQRSQQQRPGRRGKAQTLG